MSEYTITIKREILCTVYVTAENELDARNKFHTGDYSEGQEIDVLNEDICDVREDK